MVNFKALLCSPDRTTIACFQSALSELQFDCIDLAESRRILELADSEHFDFIVVDAEQLPDGIALLQEVRGTRANRDSVTFGIGRPENWEKMLQSGASVVIGKPITPDAIRRKLREAREVIENEHRRYNRQPVTLPVEVKLPDGTVLHAESANISQGGMAAQLAHDPAQHELVNLCFRLPGQAEPITLEAKVAWVDTDLMVGFRFLRVARENQAVLANWLATYPRSVATGLGPLVK